MKKLLAVILITAASHLVATAQKCNLQVKKNDFSSSVERSTEQIKIMSVFHMSASKPPWYLEMIFYSNDSTIKIILMHTSQERASAVKELFFKLADGTLIKKSEPLIGVSEQNNSGYTFKYTQFVITKEELAHFAASPIEKEHVFFYQFQQDPVVEKDLKEKLAKEVQKNAACLLAELGGSK